MHEAMRCAALLCDAERDAVVCYKGVSSHTVSSLCVRCLLCFRRVKSKKGVGSEGGGGRCSKVTRMSDVWMLRGTVQ